MEKNKLETAVERFHGVFGRHISIASLTTPRMNPFVKDTKPDLDDNQPCIYVGLEVMPTEVQMPEEYQGMPVVYEIGVTKIEPLYH